jgi:anti-sigma regulatory factor (Ser/Thr protein kinase)
MAAPKPVQWTFRATPRDSVTACREAEAWGLGAGFDPATVSTLVLVIEELFTNTIKYAYSSSVVGVVRIELAPQGGLIELTYADQGKPFDPSVAFKHWERNLEQGSVDGLGLRLIRSFGGSLRYRRVDNWNKIFLVVGDSPETN